MLLCIGYFINKKYDGDPYYSSCTNNNNINYGDRKKGSHSNKPVWSKKTGWMKKRSNNNFFFP